MCERLAAAQAQGALQFFAASAAFKDADGSSSSRSAVWIGSSMPNLPSLVPTGMSDFA
jgi:hypothetical protein